MWINFLFSKVIIWAVLVIYKASHRLAGSRVSKRSLINRLYSMVDIDIR